MKKIIFTFILIITFSSNAFSDHFYKNWGVVVDIKPIYYNQVINKPTTHKTCTRHYQRKPRLENVIIGGLIGSVIGTKLAIIMEREPWVLLLDLFLLLIMIVIIHHVNILLHISKKIEEYFLITK